MLLVDEMRSITQRSDVVVASSMVDCDRRSGHVDRVLAVRYGVPAVNHIHSGLCAGNEGQKPRTNQRSNQRTTTARTATVRSTVHLSLT